jgi:hypothetical protein
MHARWLIDHPPELVEIERSSLAPMMKAGSLVPALSCQAMAFHENLHQRITASTPPSTLMSEPVTNEASGEHRKTATEAISSAVP